MIGFAIVRSVVVRSHALPLALVAGLVLAGCASVPERLAPLPEDPVELSVARGDPAAVEGRLVVWGGVIAAVENTRDGTVLEVVKRSLDRDARPQPADVSPGRFRVYSDAFLDPRDHAPGREVTVRGRVAGSEEDRIGEHAYEFVRLEAEGVHLWERRPRPRDRYHDPWYDPLYGHWGPRGYYGPGWRYPYPRHHDPRYW